jgi:hypothetical protein
VRLLLPRWFIIEQHSVVEDLGDRVLVDGKATMNRSIHPVETLIRATPAGVRREMREVLDAYAGNPRVIVGTGD